MSEPAPARPTRAAWLRNPEMLVALSAVLLSVCGLGIALYEASLIRQAQRASVWPHVEIGASLRADAVRIWAENTGVGPARVRAAALSLDGETLTGWSDLLEEVVPPRGTGHDAFFSLVNGRVLPPRAPETIFALTEDQGSAPEAITAVREALLAGEVEVTLCYCSVYDECWTSSLQDLIGRSRDGTTARESRETGSCAATAKSGI